MAIAKDDKTAKSPADSKVKESKETKTETKTESPRKARALRRAVTKSIFRRELDLGVRR